MKQWAAKLKRDTLTVWLAARDRRVGLAPKMIAGVTAAYALSPVDLIPDFIPVLGLLDDLLIVPLGVWLALKLIPVSLRAQLRSEAAMLAEKPVSRSGLAIVILLWLAGALLAWRALA